MTDRARPQTMTYWLAPNLNDAPAYHIRARTRRECALLRKEFGPTLYGVPRQVTITYRDALDLAFKCLEPGGAAWEQERTAADERQAERLYRRFSRRP